MVSYNMHDTEVPVAGEKNSFKTENNENGDKQLSDNSMTKTRGRPRGSKNKTKGLRYTLTIIGQLKKDSECENPLRKRRGRPIGSKNKTRNICLPVQIDVLEELTELEELGKFDAGEPYNMFY